jgi:hypothetical protein
MISVSARILAMSFSWVVMSAPLLSAQDLSKYREFQLGMGLAAVAQKTGVTPVARVPHQPPELITELVWQPSDGLAASPPRDSVRKVLLSFYNGELFRIAVSYEWERTEGLTVEDMIAALSSTYGPPIPPDTELIPLLSRSAVGSDKIVAHWEDSQYSVNLVRPSYASTFGLVMLSKRLDALVRAATVEAIWLDDQQAFTRAIGRKRSQEDEDHTRQEQARTRNRATFRP